MPSCYSTTTSKNSSPNKAPNCKALAKAYGDPSLTKQFVAHAEHHRGILCSVEYPVKRPIFIERGQKVFFRFPMGCCY